MPRKTVKKVAKVDPKVEEQVKKATEEILNVQTEFRVLDRDFKYVRTYTVQRHGENAGELAKGYAKKINGYCN